MSFGKRILFDPAIRCAFEIFVEISRFFFLLVLRIFVKFFVFKVKLYYFDSKTSFYLLFFRKSPDPYLAKSFEYRRIQTSNTGHMYFITVCFKKSIWVSVLRIQDVYPGPLIRVLPIPDPDFPHPVSRMQGIKKQRIPDPQHCLYIYEEFAHLLKHCQIDLFWDKNWRILIFETKW
jgi:hypothetical protein